MKSHKIIAVCTGLAVAATILILFDHHRRSFVQVAPPSTSVVASLPELLRFSNHELAQCEIGRMNLLCAQGLPGAEDLDLNQSLRMLDQMAARVRSETGRHLYRFREHPDEFEHSEGFFRMIMLAVVLAEDFQVRYAPDKIGAIADARPGDGFFRDAHDVFLHGLTGTKRQGTCSSLPVLQVAVGRRLGYPLKLVTTKGHLFARWEDKHERFNIEAAGQGVNRFPDEYYRHWPMEVSPEEIEGEQYLKSLTPSEELAVFLSIRGTCWLEAHRNAEAAESFRVAAHLVPACRGYQFMAAQSASRQTTSVSLPATPLQPSPKGSL